MENNENKDLNEIQNVDKQKIKTAKSDQNYDGKRKCRKNENEN